MPEITDYSVQILFSNGEVIDYDYENFTLEEALKSTFETAKEMSDGIPIESVKIVEIVELE